jgi:hypothetical protein
MLANAKQRYESLMIELAARKNNEHIGSGRGGNPAQYLTMVALTPNFVNTNGEELFVVNNDSIEINVEQMFSASKKSMRLALDKALTPDVISKFAAPELIEFLSNAGPAPKDEKLFYNSKQKDLITAAKLASRIKELAILELKESDGKAPNLLSLSLSAEMKQTLNELKTLDKWLILFGCRAFIGIETIVKYNLDEIPGFAEMFLQINSAAGDAETT